MDTRPPPAARHAWQVMHPPMQAFEAGWLHVGHGHAVYWEQCGHPGAPAALFVHGGPGAGATVQDRRWFNPRQWRTVLFDQRGCGRSRAEGDGLQANTTPHLLRDMEALREHLGIPHWLLVGGSWGSTLALAYAQAFPHRVLGLVLRGVFLATQAERDALYGPEGAATSRPAAWRRLCAAAGLGAQHNTHPPSAQTLLNALHTRLRANDDAAATAAKAWWSWEQDLMAHEGPAPAAAHPPPEDEATLRMARIGVHYAQAQWFVPDGALLQHAARLHHLPGVIVQGGRDLVTPAASARALHAAWPGARLHEVPAAGHASSHPEGALAMVHAIETVLPAPQPTVTHQPQKPETPHGPARPTR